MPILRLLLAAAVAVAAIVAGLFAAMVVAAGALIGYVAMRLTGRNRTGTGYRPRPGTGTPPRAPARGDFIDVDANEVEPAPDRLPHG